jgi:DNA primase
VDEMDIIKFLEDIGVEISLSGKNIAPGWIGMNCIFCEDTTNHFGVRVEDLKCTCWKCGGHSIITLVQEYTNYTRKQVTKILKNLDVANLKLLPPPKGAAKRYRKNLFPTEAQITIPVLHAEYLKKRGFHPHLLTRKYDLRFVSTVGKYKFRIIIPYYNRRILYSFTSRAIDDRMLPYLHPRKTSVPLSPKEMIYNIDSVRPYTDCLVSEGPFDVWKFGDGSVGTSGTTFTRTQVLLLKEKKIRNLFIMMDNDIIDINGRKTKRSKSKTKALELYRLMRHHVQNAEILNNVITNDLGEMTTQDILELRQAINFNHNL